MGKKAKKPEPPTISDEVMNADLSHALIEDDVCPWCLGKLNSEWLCTKCGRDSWNYVEGIE